jgi:hypothetical protein
MRMSRERIFHLADQIVQEISKNPALVVKAPDDIRTEVVRVLTEESKLEESIDGEVRKILSTYSRPASEGSHEWEVMFTKTREEVYRRRFRL